VIISQDRQAYQRPLIENDSIIVCDLQPQLDSP